MRCTAVVAAVFGIYPGSFPNLPADLYTIQLAKYLDSSNHWSLAICSGDSQHVQSILMIRCRALQSFEGSIARLPWKEGQDFPYRRQKGSRWALKRLASSEHDGNGVWHHLCRLGLYRGTNPSSTLQRCSNHLAQAHLLDNKGRMSVLSCGSEDLRWFSCDTPARV